MTILCYNKSDMLEDYYSRCTKKSVHTDLQEMWPPSCAKVRDPFIYNRFPFALKRDQVKNVNIGNWSVNWVNSDAGTAMSSLIGIRGVDCIRSCENRIQFINSGIKKYPLLCENEIKFISTLVWLTPNNSAADSGNASFYELPHVTFISDATLFFIPPFHQLPRNFGIIGLIENLYHEALHHQVHAYNAFHGQRYCHDNQEDKLLCFPSRRDRTFNYAQAFNACYVYGEIVKYRAKVAENLSKMYGKDELLWINDALISAKGMWFNLAHGLFDVRDAFLSHWRVLIETWQVETKVENCISQWRDHYE